MNLTELLAQANGGQGFDALARRFNVTPEQAQGVAAAALPTLSSGVKRMAQEPDGLQRLAQMMRDTDAEALHDAPEADPHTVDAKGQAFLDQLFGGAQSDISHAVAEEGRGRSGLDSGLIASMLPMIASMVLGGVQKQESQNPAIGGLVGGLLNQQGGGGGGLGGMLGALTGGGSSGGGGGGLGGMLGGLMGGGGSGGNDLSPLMRMFDADRDGSVADDLLERFMRR